MIDRKLLAFSRSVILSDSCKQSLGLILLISYCFPEIRTQYLLDENPRCPLRHFHNFSQIDQCLKKLIIISSIDFDQALP